MLLLAWIGIAVAMIVRSPFDSPSAVRLLTSTRTGRPR